MGTSIRMAAWAAAALLLAAGVASADGEAGGAMGSDKPLAQDTQPEADGTLAGDRKGDAGDGEAKGPDPVWITVSLFALSRNEVVVGTRKQLAIDLLDASSYSTWPTPIRLAWEEHTRSGHGVTLGSYNPNRAPLETRRIDHWTPETLAEALGMELDADCSMGVVEIIRQILMDAWEQGCFISESQVYGAGAYMFFDGEHAVDIWAPGFMRNAIVQNGCQTVEAARALELLTLTQLEWHGRRPGPVDLNVDALGYPRPPLKMPESESAERPAPTVFREVEFED